MHCFKGQLHSCHIWKIMFLVFMNEATSANHQHLLSLTKLVTRVSGYLASVKRLSSYCHLSKNAVIVV